MIRYQLYRILNKAAKVCNISLIYETSKGVKSLNQLMQSSDCKKGKKVICDAKDLYLGFDALKDVYSLAGVNIMDSPHFDFMRALDGGDDLLKTEYCERFKTGTLDSRSGVFVSKKMLQMFCRKYGMRRQEIEKECYKPVQIYQVADKYYIADGKHRAALCAYMGQPIVCIEVSPELLQDSFRLWMYRKMMRKPNVYKKNLMLFEKSM